MVQHLYPHQFAGVLQSAGDLPVFPAGCGIAGGMVVDEDDRGGGFPDGGTEHFPWVDDALIQCTI